MIAAGKQLIPADPPDVLLICQAVNVPVVATGGVTTGRDVVEMLLVGATAVSMGTAIRYRGIDVFGRVCEELRGYMARHGHDDLASLRGKALIGL